VLGAHPSDRIRRVLGEPARVVQSHPDAHSHPLSLDRRHGAGLAARADESGDRPQGQKVQRLLVEETAPIARELYLGIVLDQGRAAKFPLPISAAAHQLYLAASAMGFGREDDASIARVFARLAGIALPGEPPAP